MSLKTRGFSVVLLAVALSGTIFMPAMAAQPSTQLSVFLPEVLVSAESAGSLERVLVGSTERAIVTNFKIEIDYADLAGVASVTPRSGASRCTVSGTVLTCLDTTTLLSKGLVSTLPELEVKPLAGVAPGTSGTWKVTVSADGLVAVSDREAVRVAEGVDLAAPGDKVEQRTGTPGAALPKTLEVDNVGEIASNGAVALFYGDPGIIATKEYSNCTFTDGRPVTCTFDDLLAPSGAYRTSEPFPFALGTDTLAPGSEWLDVQWMTKDDLALLRKELTDLGLGDWFGRPGTGAKLSLVSSPQARTGDQTEIDDTDNWYSMSVKVEGDNDADFAARGGSASGTVGQVVTLNLGLKNLGPASRDSNRVGGGTGIIDVTLPPGSSLAAMPEGCNAMTKIGEDWQHDPDSGNLAARFIRCVNPSSYIKFGTEVTFPVKLRIDQVISSATGSVAILTNGCDTCRRDKNPANDTAAVVLNGPSLPTTGVQTGLIAGGGALLAVLGAAAFVFGRRRRFKLTESA